MNNLYNNSILKILNSREINLFNENYDFNGARRAIFNSEAINLLMKKMGITNIYEVSSGVSDEKAYRGYLRQFCNDILNDCYYRNYYGNKGEPESRKALAFYENIKFNDSIYSGENFCFTEGSTGAISAFIEFFSNKFPDKNVIITNPCYYLYRSACKYYKVKYKEVNLFSKKKKITFTSIKSILDSIDKNTKLIIINNPFNPSGEVYSKKDLIRLFATVKKLNILILVDELFQDLVFEQTKFICSDKIAYKESCLNNLIIVKGYSKNKNLVAFRLGYIFSKNREIIEAVAKINQVRQSFPTACNSAGLITLDAFIQSVLLRSKKPSEFLNWVKKIRLSFPENKTINKKKDEELVIYTREYNKYYLNLMKKYSQGYDLCYRLLRNNSLFCMPKISAFNTFFKIKKLDNINMFDFTLNLYIYTGVKIEIGPCFGFNQKDWETNPNLGFWLRLTFAKNKAVLKEGIKRFIDFSKRYTSNKSKYIETGLRF